MSGSGNTCVVSLKVSRLERERWVEAAGGGSLNGWARGVLGGEADRVLAERLRVEDRVAEGVRVRAALRPFKPDFKKG